MLRKFVDHFENFGLSIDDGVTKKSGAGLLALEYASSIILLLNLN